MKTLTGIDFTLGNYLLVNNLLLYCRLFNIYIYICFYFEQPYGQPNTTGNIQQQQQFKHPVR